ncbi:hypothetical protein PU630_13415 [Microbacterium horticulturae]|uniref:Uncharacterized protein n=1 Tax=Microbacterium horticulturae TaxID=3028316 RepID=A0ABY8BVP1_9MICO|nr:hypothetical protein [Microbacterium sp. KACC 23027]WEG08226.1 hypothetical protein PU630_13415 [Microbacterium sp. KACC 23027]
MDWWQPDRSWRAGDWTLRLRGDELADIAFAGRPVLRSIRAVVRDHDWNTAALVVDGIGESAGGLTLQVRASGAVTGLSGTVRAAASGRTLTVELDLAVAADLDTNRTGLVVLHPADLAGAGLRVRHGDGSHEDTLFPAAISPHQPVFDITTLSWRAAGLDVEATFSGDVFEMEDQRNWTDASYKTYSRPLALPFPYRLGAGTHVRQRIEVRAGRDGGDTGGEDAAAAAIALAAAGPFPEISLGAATAPAPAPRVEPIGQAVLVELDLAAPNWHAALDRAATAGLPLDVRLVARDTHSLDAAAQALRGRSVARVAAFRADGEGAHVSDAALVAALRAALGRAGVVAAVIGGARSHFTEFNREHHRLPDALDGITFSVTGLFHSTSTQQLVESIAIQRLVATQAVGLAGDTPVHIGPVTLRPRFNNVATTPAPGPGAVDLRNGYGAAFADADDPRQITPELAAWTIASAAALAVPGVASLTFFEEWGPRGIRSSGGEELPVAAAVRALAAQHGGRLLCGDSPDGLVWAIGADDTVLIANLDRRDRRVELESPDGGRVFVEVTAGSWRRTGL